MSAPSLSLKGVGQVEKLYEKLKDFRIPVIYTSPLKRSKETAEILSNHLNAEIREHHGLVEQGLGILEGFTQDEFSLKYPECKIELDNRKSVSKRIDFDFCGGESLIEVQNRIDRAIKFILHTDQHDSIAISSHGTAISCFLNKNLNFFSDRYMRNCELFIIKYNIEEDQFSFIVEPNQ